MENGLTVASPGCNGEASGNGETYANHLSYQNRTFVRKES